MSPLRPPEVAQGPAPVVLQAPAPYAPVQDTNGTSSITDMINAIMPLVMIMMMMGMLMPMMKGITGQAAK